MFDRKRLLGEPEIHLLSVIGEKFPDPECLEAGTYTNEEFYRAWGPALFFLKLHAAMPDPDKANHSSVRQILSFQLDDFNQLSPDEQNAQSIVAVRELPNLLLGMIGNMPGKGE